MTRNNTNEVVKTDYFISGLNTQENRFMKKVIALEKKYDFF